MIQPATRLVFIFLPIFTSFEVTNIFHRYQLIIKLINLHEVLAKIMQSK